MVMSEEGSGGPLAGPKVEPLTDADVRSRVPRRGSIPAAETLLAYARVVLGQKPGHPAACEMLKIAMTLNHMAADNEDALDQLMATEADLRAAEFQISELSRTQRTLVDACEKLQASRLSGGDASGSIWNELEGIARALKTVRTQEKSSQ
jgi:hypothetical protein